MHLYGRPGDLVIRRIDPSTATRGEFTPERDVVVAGQSSGVHTIRGPALVRREGRVTHVILDKPTEIVHASRHQGIPLKAGEYTFTPQRERHDGADRAVED